jgi:hypothetical protein
VLFDEFFSCFIIFFQDFLPFIFLDLLAFCSFPHHGTEEAEIFEETRISFE